MNVNRRMCSIQVVVAPNAMKSLESNTFTCKILTLAICEGNIIFQMAFVKMMFDIFTA